MTNLSDDTFEFFLFHVFNQDLIDPVKKEVSNRVDLRDVSFIDPYGMVGILKAGEFLKPEKRTLLLPESEDVLRYLERMDFFKYASRYFILEPSRPEISGKYLRSAGTDVLLEITSIEKSDDVHFIVGKVKKRAHAILERHLHYDERTINGFIVALSEVCQNILEHSENTGLVGIQKYHFQKLDKNVVKIAVMDLGIGFKKSLETRFQIKDDIDALEKALLHGVSRYADEGRGHGLSAVRRFVSQWRGKLSIRSGTAKLSLIPSRNLGPNRPRWVVPTLSKREKREKNLVHFPGAQINIMLPEV
jgi:anti-sigma regulatory factor (Ser/Thr protein kinase)